MGQLQAPLEGFFFYILPVFIPKSEQNHLLTIYKLEFFFTAALCKFRPFSIHFNFQAHVLRPEKGKVTIHCHNDVNRGEAQRVHVHKT